MLPPDSRAKKLRAWVVASFLNWNGHMAVGF